MGQLVNVISTIVKAPQMAPDCSLGLGGLNQAYRSNHPTMLNVYNNIFTRCVIRNQFDILLTAIANVRKE